jgi:4,5-DOPA dioxygenase extradiol
MELFPSLFVSHGPPNLLLMDCPVRRFLADYGAILGRPRAILAVSAHWETAAPAVGTSKHPETIHDFFGFPPPLYALRYPAPGAPGLAKAAAQRLETAGFTVVGEPTRGLDHGTWAPLMLLYPEADLPVAQLAIQTSLGPTHHLALGEALRPLRGEGVLILGSGNLTHNLAEFRGQAADAPVPDWVQAFADWVAARLAADDRAALLEYRANAPHGGRNHPSEDHLLPLFVTLGAATPGAGSKRVHASTLHGVLAMDAYRFE